LAGGERRREDEPIISEETSGYFERGLVQGTLQGEGKNGVESPRVRGA